MNKALLVVSHGTHSLEQFNSGIAGMERTLAEAFPDRAFRRAFVSGRARTRLRNQYGVVVDGIAEAMAALRLDGFTDVLVQPAFLSEEEEELEELRQKAGLYARQFQSFAFGRPLLSTLPDYLEFADALLFHAPTLLPEEALVLVGAGGATPMDPKLACLDYMLRDRGDLPVCVGALDGYPGLSEVTRRLQDNWGAKRVCLQPLFLTVELRARYEVLSDEPDAWASQLRASGFEVRTLAQGLGENPGVQALLVSHAQEALSGRRGWRGL